MDYNNWPLLSLYNTQKTTINISYFNDYYSIKIINNNNILTLHASIYSNNVWQYIPYTITTSERITERSKSFAIIPTSQRPIHIRSYIINRNTRRKQH